VPWWNSIWQPASVSRQIELRLARRPSTSDWYVTSTTPPTRPAHPKIAQRQRRVEPAHLNGDDLGPRVPAPRSAKLGEVPRETPIHPAAVAARPGPPHRRLKVTQLVKISVGRLAIVSHARSVRRVNR